MTEMSDLLANAHRRGLQHLSITPLAKGWWQVSGRWSWSQGGYRVAIEETAEAALRKALAERPDMAAERPDMAINAPLAVVAPAPMATGGVFD